MVRPAALLALLLLSHISIHAGEVRSFRHAEGEAEIPAKPRRIVSLHDSHITTPLVELGAPVVGSHGRLGTDGEPYIRGVRDFPGMGFEALGVTFMGAFNGIDVELIAVLEPDLIITTPWQGTPVAQLEKIAPTVVMPMEEGSSLEAYRMLADAAGRLDAFERRRARYERRIAALREWIGTPEETSIAKIQAWDGQISVHRNYGAFAQVTRNVGFAEPALVRRLRRRATALSAELLPEITADFVFDTFEPNFGDTPESARERMSQALPGWCERLFACREDQYVLLPRTRASANSFAAFDFVIDQLATHIAGRDYTRYPASNDDGDGGGR